jgi:pyrimidine operon attenuation protein/uracil phosphoribosyltransferase
MSKELLDNNDIKRAITRMAHEIVEKNRGIENLCLVGIQKGGVILARRLAKQIESIEGMSLEIGALDITLYRDDLNTKDEQPFVKETDIQFSINGKTVVIVDDVLFTGRSIRAALDALVDFGRADNIQLAVLIDRGHRELPIRADYVGKNIPTAFDDRVDVMLREEGTENRVTLVSE